MVIFMSIEQAKTEEIQRVVRLLQNNLYLTEEQKKNLESELNKLVKQRDVMRETLKKYKR